MKIVHIILSNFYKEGYGYQENILPAKHKELGHDVAILTYRGQHHIIPENKDEYINSEGVKVVVLPSSKSMLLKVPIIRIATKKTCGLYQRLEQERPDIVFCHGFFIKDYSAVISYKEKHPEVKLFMDNHADFYNTPVSGAWHKRLSRSLLMKPIIKRMAELSVCVWCVTPWRRDYLRDVYDVDPAKLKLLVMGGDEKYLNWENRSAIRKTVREQLGIPEEAFVAITGGKIDKPKNADMLVKAFDKIGDEDTHLIIFGEIADKSVAELIQSLGNDRIHCIGWIKSNDVYNYYHASDLAVFPGTHSVLWEQAIASGLPCIFKDWNGGFNHVDVGGNCILISEPTAEKLEDALRQVLTDGATYKSLLEVASGDARNTFAYLQIARRAIMAE